MQVGQSQPDRLEAIFAQCANDTGGAGLVLTGVLDEAEIRFLEQEQRPFVILGDARSLDVPPTLPVVAADNFQGGFLAAEDLLAAGCNRLVLLNFGVDPE